MAWVSMTAFLIAVGCAWTVPLLTRSSIVSLIGLDVTVSEAWLVIVAWACCILIAEVVRLVWLFRLTVDC